MTQGIKNNVLAILKKYNFVEIDDESLYVSLKKCIKHKYVLDMMILLKYGANPHYDENLGTSPLGIAIEFENIQAIFELMKYGVNINSPEFYGYTPLHFSIDQEGDAGSQYEVPPKICSSGILLRSGANPYLKNDKGETAIDLAVFYKHHEFLQLVDLFFN